MRQPETTLLLLFLCFFASRSGLPRRRLPSLNHRSWCLLSRRAARVDTQRNAQSLRMKMSEGRRLEFRVWRTVPGGTGLHLATIACQTVGRRTGTNKALLMARRADVVAVKPRCSSPTCVRAIESRLRADHDGEDALMALEPLPSLTSLAVLFHQHFQELVAFARRSLVAINLPSLPPAGRQASITWRGACLSQGGPGPASVWFHHWPYKGVRFPCAARWPACESSILRS